MAEENHKITQTRSVKTGHEFKLQDGTLVETHDWWEGTTDHRFECECGDKFNEKENAIEHLKSLK